MEDWRRCVFCVMCDGAQCEVCVVCSVDLFKLACRVGVAEGAQSLARPINRQRSQSRSQSVCAIVHMSQPA